MSWRVEGCVHVQVEVDHMGHKKRYKVRALSDRSARSYVFDNDEHGQQMSVEAYYLLQYKIR